MHYGSFVGQIFALYEKQEYAGALALIDREGGRFPEAAGMIAFWQACMLALTGAPERALQVLQNGLEAGLWWDGRMLLSDADLAPLHTRPEFDEILSVCRMRQALAQESARPVLESHAPEAAGAAPLLLVLHGNTGRNWDTGPYWQPAVADGWHLALAQSSQMCAPGGFVWNNRETATAEVQAHVAALAANPAVDGSVTVLGGFSRGAGTAMWLALTGAVPARGFVVVAPAFPQMAEEAALWVDGAVRRGVRGYILIGEKDAAYVEAARATAELLRSRGMACELEVVPDLGHNYPANFQTVVLPRALAFVTGR